MNPMKLYRVLQQHAGRINDLVVKLYNDGIEPEQALSIAQDEAANLTDTLKELAAEDK
ncbi:MAG: hypothetical protein JW884_14280 [Deltaproteobacteria bacterium]|nr:hypothetical protein [Deltaproteobacteria bacterium]